MPTRRLFDVVKQEEESAKNEKAQENKKRTVLTRLAEVDEGKGKQISAKVNAATYEQFSKINRLQGLSNNSVLNQLIFRYVRENKGLLEEEQ